MIRPNIIKIPSFSDWLLTFTILDPATGLPATQDNTFAKFCLYERPMDKTPLWSCEWNTGIQEDQIRPGVIHILVPRKISDYLPPGIYSFSLDIVSKNDPNKIRKDCGTIESVKMDPNGGVQFGVSDNVARRMVGQETMRAMRAEEDLREDIGQGGGGDIHDGSVTTQKISDQAVTTPKISNGAVTADKIANGSITADKLDPNALPTPIIPAGSITPDKLEDHSITQQQLDPDLIQDVDDVASAAAGLFEVGTVSAADEDDGPYVDITHAQGKYQFNFRLVSGFTPEIDPSSKHWVINDVDTGIVAEGSNGNDGVGIASVSVGNWDPIRMGQPLVVTFTNGDTYEALISQVVSSNPSDNPSIVRFSETTLEDGDDTEVVNVTSYNYLEVINRVYTAKYSDDGEGNTVVHKVKFVIDTTTFTDYQNVIFPFNVQLFVSSGVTASDVADLVEILEESVIKVDLNAIAVEIPFGEAIENLLKIWYTTRNQYPCGQLLPALYYEE